MKKQYDFDGNNRFVISDYNRSKPFSSFLPGITGVDGKPLWVLYVNRGQGIASFGVQDKDGAIMEFYPANKSYQLVPTQGFRTFIKVDNEVIEPFAYHGKNEGFEEKMYISPNLLEIESINKKKGIAVQVSYYAVPHESFAGLVRHVMIKNLTTEAKQVEVLDGMPVVLPYGLKNIDYKDIGHTLKSWMDVYNREANIPYYKLRASTTDSVEVSSITGGHFYLSFTVNDGKEQLLSPIVDVESIFGQNSSLISPDVFYENTLSEIMTKRQITTNKVPCGFSGVERTLAPSEQTDIYTLIGHVSDIEQINKRVEELTSSIYMDAKKREAEAVVEQLTDHVETQTSSKYFDAYARQCYLDNVLRGGQPEFLETEGEPFVYHVFSRKHGDLERDYNFFSTNPSYYSQGNGNYRDVNQNRRSDVLIHPEVKDFNVKMLLSLVQADGYNPLVIKGCSFKVKDVSALMSCVSEADQKQVEKFLSKAYTPGDLLAFIENQQISLTIPVEAFLTKALTASDQSFEANFGEGYWIDHWTYNMDLVESYLAIYPDQFEQLLFNNKDYFYFDSPATVLSRDQKVVLAQGEVRQFGAIVETEEKEKFIHGRKDAKNWVRLGNGHGEIYKTNLYEKLASLALIKFATIDPEGVGIEMEAGKPGWNDSLNGLPGLFASGFSELSELQRLLGFLLDAKSVGPEEIEWPVEIADLLMDINKVMDELESLPKETNPDFWLWDQLATVRETFRMLVNFGFDGQMKQLSKQAVEKVLQKCLNKVNEGIQKAFHIGNGLFPTYFYYKATSYEPILDDAGVAKYNAKGQPLVKVTAFERVDLPRFLEGPTKAMKTIADKAKRHELYTKIKQSDLYDQKLKMYKVNTSLENEPHEIGRARAFTPGWLENESVFLHMEYKYLLELLKGELYDEFFETMKEAMVPFLDPETYGRSSIENSSFIASSANPDPNTHGVGFVARLSGSTAEFLSMWNIMMWGKQPFVMEDGELCLKLKPIIPAWLFDQADQVKAKFLGSCDVTYHNPNRKNTYDLTSQVDKLELTLGSGEVQKIEGNTIKQPLATLVRKRQVKSIDVYMS